MFSGFNCGTSSSRSLPPHFVLNFLVIHCSPTCVLGLVRVISLPSFIFISFGSDRSPFAEEKQLSHRTCSPLPASFRSPDSTTIGTPVLHSPGSFAVTHFYAFFHFIHNTHFHHRTLSPPFHSHPYPRTLRDLHPRITLNCGS